jgi:hypothetical protein
MAFYSDSALSVAWSADTVHPGGEQDLDIPVYVSYIEGVWDLVDSYNTLKTALSGNKNVYLTKDVDCEGKELYVEGTYTGIIKGNNYTVSNFTVPRKGTGIKPSCALFNDLGAGCKIENVSFTNVKYDYTGVNAGANELKVAALALSAAGAEITGVTVTGTIVSNRNEAELTRLQQFIFDENNTAKIDATSSVAVSYEKQA